MEHPWAPAFPWTRCFVVVAALLGVTFVFLTPALAGTDESAHVARVAMIETGQVIPPKTWTQVPGGGADGCITAYLYRFRAAGYAQETIPWTEQFRNPRCETPGWSITGIAHTADVYSPVPYVPALVGFRLGRAVGGAAGSVYGARLVQVAAFIALMAFAIRRTPWGKPLLFTIGLLPVVIQGAANVSADPLTLAFACCVIALALAGIDRARSNRLVDARSWWAFAFVSVALALSKSAYVPLVLLVLAIPTAAFGVFRRRIAIGAASLAAAGVAAGAWNLGVVAQLEITGVNRSDSKLATAWIRYHPLGFVEAVFRGWGNPHERQALIGGVFTPVRRFAENFPLPHWLGVLWLVAVRLVDPLPRWIARIRPRGDPVGGSVEAAVLPRRDRIIAGLVALGVAVVSIALIEYGLAIAANPPGAHEIVWVQGRYFLPLVPLTLFGVTGVARPLGRCGSMLIAGVSISIGVLWIFWASHNAWAWF